MPNAAAIECSAGAATTGPANPFDAHFASLRRLQNQLSTSCLSTAHVLTDLSRIMHDIVSAAATNFLLCPLPPPSTSLTSLTYSAHSLQQSSDSFIRRLRAACILSVDDSRQVDRLTALLGRATESAGYEVRQERVAELTGWLLGWLQRLDDNWQLSQSASTAPIPASSQLARVCESSAVLPVIATAAVAAVKPISSWTELEWAQHCQPLWNTTQLSLAQAEEEDNEKEKAAEEERKAILAQVKQREKEKREAAKQKQLDRQDRQQQRTERAADRAKRLDEGEIDAEDAKKEEEEEQAKQREEDEAEVAEQEEKEEELHVPPPVVRHTPLTFCCLSCHATLLTPATIHRVHSNTIWSNKAAKIDTLFKNMADVWEQENEEHDSGRDSTDDEDADADAMAGDELSDEAKAQRRRRSTTAAVHCARCFAYVGRWFVKEDQYRLVYIDRLTGRNWLFVTGDEATIQNKLTPLLVQGKESDEAEAEAEEEEDEDDNGEKRPKPVKEEVVPAVVGLPTSYASPAQARQYPFPRFPVTAIAQTAAAINDNFPPLPPSLVTGLMSSSADPLYALSSPSAPTLSLLLRSDPALHARVLLLLVSRNVERVFSSFASSAYASPSSCPVPAFTHFYLSPPQLTHARGTARYAFHYLTQRDDSKVKRQQWSVKRVRDAQRKAGELSALFVIAGGWGGMRAVVLKVAGAYRVLQSNELCRDKADRYTLSEWLSGNSRWSRVLDEEEWSEWLGKYERARRGERAVWEELFCRGKSVEVLGCSQPQDMFKDSDCQFSISKLVLDHMTVD